MSLIKQLPQLRFIQRISAEKKIKIYLIGGFLRDYLLGRACQDFDFAVSKDSLKISKLFARGIKGAFVLLDEERGCARVVKKVEGKPYTFDFADYRASSLQKDLRHRDFTINTLYADISKISDSVPLEKIIENSLGGKEDIKRQAIRMTSRKIFKEDPLRLMRAFSLQSVLDFKIEKDTLGQIKKDKKLIREVSSERVRDELFKILDSQFTAKNFRQMDKIGLLEAVMPQVTVMYNIRQGGYHHLDVWKHSLETVAQTEVVLKQMQKNSDVAEYVNESLGGARKRAGLIKLAALLHDIGKPATLKREPDRISFHGHEHVGKSMVRSIAKMLKLSTRERFALEDIVLWHLRPGYLSNFKNPSERAVFRFLRDAKDEAASILLMSLADQRSTRGPLTTEYDQRHHEKICLKVLQIYFSKKKEKPFVRLITGHDLIKFLKLPPSPIFAKILKGVEEQQALGKITTKREALELAEKIIKR